MLGPDARPQHGDTVPPEELHDVVEATRVIGGLIAESLAQVEPAVTMPQWRVLVLASQGPCNVSAVAEDLGVHPSNATRICDRLVKAGLLARRKDPGDRRQVRLSPTRAGRRLFEAAMAYRRDHVEAALLRLGEEQRAALAAGISAFGEALAAVHDEWSSGSQGEPDDGGSPEP